MANIGFNAYKEDYILNLNITLIVLVWKYCRKSEITALPEIFGLNKDDARIFSHLVHGNKNGDASGGKVRRLSDAKIEKICDALGIGAEDFKSQEEKKGLFSESTEFLRLLQHEVIYRVDKKDGVLLADEEAKHKKEFQKLLDTLMTDYRNMSSSVFPKDGYGRVLYYIRHEEKPDLSETENGDRTAIRIWNMLSSTKPKAFWGILDQMECNPEDLYKLACNLESESVLLKARWMLESNRRLEYKREAVTKKDVKELEENS